MKAVAETAKKSETERAKENNGLRQRSGGVKARLDARDFFWNPISPKDRAFAKAAITHVGCPGNGRSDGS